MTLPKENFTNRNVDVLVIDDIRCLYFNPAYLGTTNVTYARTSEEALQKLQERGWDEVWLDHDLGWEDDIWPVLDYLLETPDLKIGEIYIHTTNPPTRDRMYLAISRLTDYPVRIVSLYGVAKMPWVDVSLNT